MDGESLNIKDDNLQKLKELFPELFVENELDWEKLKAAFSNDINFSNERYVLNWAGKADAFKSLQIPTTATLIPCIGEGINDFPQFDKSGKSLNPENHACLSGRQGSDNVFIEGENLEVLKVLQKAYYGKVKCIVIDPPYNTGNDSFIYPDSFKENKADYEKRIGDKDEEGYLMKEGLFRKNSKDSGHFHSNWLSMMYPRLFLAKNLLRDDGVIFIHIDDNEVHNLRLLMNEIFGEENFFAQIIVRSNSRGQTYKQIAKTHEYILIYTRNFESELNELEKNETNNDLNLKDNIGNFNIRELRNRNPKFGKHNRPNLFYPIYVNPNQFDEQGFYSVSLEISKQYSMEVLPLNSEKKESCWRWGKRKCIININENTLISNLIAKKKTDGAFGIYEKYRKTTYKPKSIWDNNSFLTETGTVELRQLGLENIFDFPKPVALETQILNLSIEDDDIILDFFGGSGTTAQALLKLNKEDGGNRKFILVQLPEPTDENSEAFKAGYKTIADISKERIRRVIKRMNHDSPGSKITLSKDKEQHKLFDENQDNHANPRLNDAVGQAINHGSDNGDGSDNGFKVFKLSSSNFKIWRGNEITEENLVQQLDAFTNPVNEGSQKINMLYELMLKSGYQLTDKVQLKDKYYSVNDDELIIALEEMNQTIIDKIIAAKPQKVIALDNLFAGNDQLKTNTVLQMRDAGVEFKTI